MAAPVKATDHALPNGNGNGTANASPGGMTNTDKAAVSSMLHKDENKGAAVHAFDPDATPEQKAAAAGKAREQLASLPGAKADTKEGGRAVALDSSSVGAPAPTVSLKEIDLASRAEGEVPGGEAIPGSIPAGAAPPIPTWMLTGWRQVAGLDAMAVRDTKTIEQLSILSEYLTEQMYGSWYHNAGIIIFAVVATRFFTVLHLGWGWVVLIMASCASYYSLSISRTRQRARDDIQRELVKTRLVTETESADWLNGFLDRFWLIYEPVLSQTIVASVDAVLAANTPSFLESIRLSTFTLGTKAPRIDYVRTFPKTPEDIVIMDWAISFTPNDLQDITPRQAAKRVNPKIVLSIKIGKGAVSKSLPILLEDMSFTGRMRIKLKLMSNFPHIQTVDMSFIEKPTFDYVLKPLGGDTFGFDINNIPGLAPFIRDQVHANLGPMMYDPNVFTIDLQALLSGTPLDSAIGVLKITILDANGLKAVKLGGGNPDPYVAISLGAKPTITKTKTIPSTGNPQWNETQFVLINSLADVLNLNLFDYNDHRPDNLLGTVSHELSRLEEDAEQEGVVGKIISGGKDRGELRYDLSYFPVLKPVKAADGTIEPLPDTATGVVRLTIHQAKDLDISRAHGELNPYARVFLGGSREATHKTPVMKHAREPIWESATEFLVAEKNNSVATVDVVDHKELQGQASLGKATVKLVDLLEAKERGQDWFPLKGSRAGKIRLTAEWKPVAMTGSISGAAAYVPPIGILRVWLKKAVDVKNVEATLGGKSDPYVRVMGNNKILARTEVINNNLNPEWDQIVYVPIHSLRERLILELMDYQNIGKDRTLGIVELNASEFVQQVSDPKYPYESKGHQVRSDRIKLDRTTYKGQLMYEVDFCPAVSIKGGVHFDAQKNELEIAAEAAAATPNGSGTGTPQPLVINGSTANGSSAALPTSPTSPTSIRSPVGGHKPSMSLGGQSVVSTKTAATADTGITAAEDPEVGVELTTAELLASQSGIFVFQVISGQLARKGSLEVMFDDGYWPSFVSEKARSNRPTWDQVGEGFVRELEFSRIWLRINAADDTEKEDIVAELKTDTRSFLESCLNNPTDFLLSQADGAGRSTVRIAARYVPVDIKLEPRESINNMGVLRVDVVGAKGLMAADRGGKSDPYVVFNLNGNRAFKSETKKKTLTPVWNEAFEVIVPSRVAAKFNFEVNDWNQVNSSTPLGGNTIDLAALEPFEQTEMHVPVIIGGAEKGQITLRLLFQPEIIARTRQKTSTFSGAGRALTGVPVGVGKNVIHGGAGVVMGVGHGVGAVGGFAGRRIGLIKKKDKSGKEVLVPSEVDQSLGTLHEGDGLPAAGGAAAAAAASAGFEVPAGQVSQPSGLNGINAATTLPPGQGEGPGEPGSLTVTVLGAKDLKPQGSHTAKDVKPYVQIKLGGRAHKTDHAKGVEPQWNETFTFNVAPGTSAFAATVYDHHSFGKDPELGEAQIDIWRHIQPPSLQTADVSVELTAGTGLLFLKLEWTPGSASKTTGGTLRRSPSISSKGPDSPSRFSLTPKKKAEKE